MICWQKCHLSAAELGALLPLLSCYIFNLLLLCCQNLNLASTVTFPVLSPASAGVPNLSFSLVYYFQSNQWQLCLFCWLTHAGAPLGFLLENYLPLRQSLCCLTVLLIDPLACYQQSFAAKSNRNNWLAFCSLDSEWRCVEIFTFEALLTVKNSHPFMVPLMVCLKFHRILSSSYLIFT